MWQQNVTLSLMNLMLCCRWSTKQVKHVMWKCPQDDSQKTVELRERRRLRMINDAVSVMGCLDADSTQQKSYLWGIVLVAHTCRVAIKPCNVDSSMEVIHSISKCCKSSATHLKQVFHFHSYSQNYVSIISHSHCLYRRGDVLSLLWNKYLKFWSML